MLKKILLALLVVVAGFLLFVSTRPDTYHVERSASVSAPPEVVFDRVNDLHGWADWSPWDKLDPAMKKTFSGPESGPRRFVRLGRQRQGGRGQHADPEPRPGRRISVSS